jgi:glyoxylase-like metal-dependent hydrolase (beta-lactamase superfamily II)
MVPFATRRRGRILQTARVKTRSADRSIKRTDPPQQRSARRERTRRAVRAIEIRGRMHRMNASFAAPVVRSFHHAESGTWSHVVVDAATKSSAIVDPVLDFDLPTGLLRTASAQRILEYVDATGLSVEWILETHAHADHVSACAWLSARTGAKIGVGAGIVEVQKTFKRLLDLGDDFPTDGSPFDRLFADEDAFSIGELAVRVISTPGHTSDSVTYLAGDAAFVGDTLFAPNAGTARCDFPGGDAATLHRSIMRLYGLPEATRVFLCHDYPAADATPTAEVALGAEKNANAHVRATTEESEYVALRTGRDATLAIPKLLWSALQINLRGGRLPPAEGGRAYLKLPIAFAAPP